MWVHFTCNTLFQYKARMFYAGCSYMNLFTAKVLFLTTSGGVDWAVVAAVFVELENYIVRWLENAETPHRGEHPPLFWIWRGLLTQSNSKLFWGCAWLFVLRRSGGHGRLECCNCSATGLKFEVCMKITSVLQLVFEPKPQHTNLPKVCRICHENGSGWPWPRNSRLHRQGIQVQQGLDWEFGLELLYTWSSSGSKDTFLPWQDAAAVFQEADLDGNGSITFDEFTQHLEDLRVQAFLRSNMTWMKRCHWMILDAIGIFCSTRTLMTFATKA